MSSSILLVGAVFASLAFGVLLAYGVCDGIFHLFRVHAESTARRGETASASVSKLVLAEDLDRVTTAELVSPVGWVRRILLWFAASGLFELLSSEFVDPAPACAASAAPASGGVPASTISGVRVFPGVLAAGGDAGRRWRLRHFAGGDGSGRGRMADGETPGDGRSGAGGSGTAAGGRWSRLHSVSGRVGAGRFGTTVALSQDEFRGGVLRHRRGGGCWFLCRRGGWPGRWTWGPDRSCRRRAARRRRRLF